MTDRSHSLPHGWRWVRLGDVIAQAKPGFASGARDPEGVVQLRMNNVDTRGRMVWSEFIRVPAEDSVVNEYQLAPGDVLFNNTNSVELVGKSALFLGFQEPVVYSNHFTRLRAKPLQLDPQYLGAWLLQQCQLKVFENLCNRWIGQSAVKNDKLMALEIPLPSLTEQQRIAAILNEQMAAVERARAAAEAQLEAAKALPAAYLRAAFSSPEAQQWPRKPLGEVSQLKNGINFTSSQKGRGTLTVDVLNMYSESVHVQMDGLYRVDVQPKDEYRLQAGDILFVRSSVKREGVAWPAVFAGYAEPVTFCGFLIRARLTTPVIQSPFLIHYLRLPQIRESLVSKSGTGTITNIGQEDLKALPIPLPPLPDQERIAAILNAQKASANQTRKAIEEELDTINKLPAALLRRAFSGAL